MFAVLIFIFFNLKISILLTSMFHTYGNVPYNLAYDIMLHDQVQPFSNDIRCYLLNVCKKSGI